MASESYIDYVEELSAPWMLGDLSAGWFGVLAGVVADTVAEGFSLALKMPWLLDPESPDDVLPLIGAERRLPRYPLETAAQYRSRLHDAWDAYQFGGTEYTIIRQFELAGYPGVRIEFRPSEPGPFGQPAPYWSQFWVVFPVGTHPVTVDGPTWDSFNWDDGTLWGPLGITQEFAATIRGIVKKWKPVDWICRGFAFEFGGANWDEFNWDDGTVWGGYRELEF